MDETHDRGFNLDGLKQLRDEIRLKLHLAQLDAKEKWQELEQQLEALEHRVVGNDVAEATNQLGRDLKQSLLDFRARLSE